MKLMKKLVSVVIVASMLMSSIATVTYADNNGVDDKLLYVSLGASQTAGYGLAGYLPADVEADPLAGNKTEMNVYGFDREPKAAYPTLVADALDLKLEQKAISSMRIEELRFLLDETYTGDAYMDWRFYDVFGDGYDWGVNPQQWFVTAGKEAADDDSLSDEAALAALRADYKDAIANAEVISLELGLNNFGVYAFNNIKVLLSNDRYIETRGWHPEKEYYFAPDFEIMDAMCEKLGMSYAELKASLMAMLAGNIEFGEVDVASVNATIDRLVAKYATDRNFPGNIARIRDELPNELSMEVKIGKIIDVLAYAMLGYCYNFDIVIEKIYDLNPDAKVIVVGIQNMMHGTKLDFNGMELPLGEVFREMLDMANLYSASGSPYADKYYYADVGEHATTFLDEILAWNGDPATLTTDMKACFDMYADQLYVRSIIEYMMVGNALSTVFKSVRDAAAAKGLDIFKDSAANVADAKGYIYEFGFDTSALDPSTLNLSALDLINPDTPLEYYGAAVSKHLKNVRKGDVDAYDYAFKALLKPIEDERAAAVATKSDLEAQLVEATDPVQIATLLAHIAGYEAGIAEADAGIQLIKDAQAGFKAVLTGVYAAYDYTLNYAYDAVATILQAAAKADTMVLSTDGMEDYDDAVNTLTGILSDAIINGSTQNFTYKLKEAGVTNAGPDAPYNFVMSDGLFTGSVATIALMFVRFELGSGFFVHPNADGHKEMAADILYALENKVSGDEFTKEKLEVYIPAAYKFAYQYALENGYIDMAAGYIDEALAAVNEAENIVKAVPVVAELANTKALLLTEIGNVRNTLVKAKAVLGISELNAETWAQILALRDELSIHVAAVEALAEELGVLEAGIKTQFAKFEDAAEYYAGVIERIANKAYDKIVAEADNFAKAYLEVVDTIVAAVSKVNADLATVVRAYLTETPAEAIAIIYACGEDAVDEFIEAAISVSGDIETIIQGISAVLEGDVRKLAKAIENSDAVTSIVARIAQIEAELNELYAALKKNPIGEALALEEKIAVAESQMRTLETELVNAITAVIAEQISPTAAVMVEKAFFALCDAIEVAEAAGTKYGKWFAGRLDLMAGELLKLIIDSTEKYGLIAGTLINDMIWNFLNDIEEDINDYIDIQIPDIDLSEVDNIINEIRASTASVRAMLASIKKYAGPQVSGMIAELEVALDQAEDYADKLQALVNNVEDLVNKIEDEPELTIEKVMTIVAQTEEIAIKAQALITEVKVTLEFLGQVYEDIMAKLAQYAEGGSPADKFLDTTDEKFGSFITITESGYENTVAALETAAADIENIISQTSSDICTVLVAAVNEIMVATEKAITDIVDEVDDAYAVILEQAQILTDSSDVEIRKAGEKILTLDCDILEIKLIEKYNEVEEQVYVIIDTLENVRTIEDIKASLPKAHVALETIYAIVKDINIFVKNDVAAVLGEIEVLAESAKLVAMDTIGNLSDNAVASYEVSANAVIKAIENAGEAIKVTAHIYENTVCSVAGYIVETVTKATEDISGVVGTAIGTTTESIEDSIRAAEDCTVIDAFQNALYDATHGEYVVDNDSYYVSLGDSTVTGYGADFGANPEGYNNLGYNTIVPSSFPYMLAEKLGLDVHNQYVQLGMAGLRTNDLLFILDDTMTPDDYFNKRVLEQYINTAGGGLDAMRETYKAELSKADIVTIAIGNCNFTGVQETGIISAWLGEALYEWLNNPYFGSAIKNAISDLGINLDAPRYAADWECYLTADELYELYAVMEEIKAAIIANGIPEEMTIDIGELLELPLASGSIVVSVPVSDLIGQFIEWYAYCYVTHVLTYDEVLDNVRAITRPDAQIVIVSMFNPMDELVITFGDLEIPVGEYIDNVLRAVNISGFTYSMTNINTTYVSVPDVESVADYDMAQTGNTFDLIAFLGKYAAEVNGNFTNHHETVAGHAYIAETIYEALNVTVDFGEYLLGDIDNDGDVDLNDWITLRQYLLGNVELTNAQQSVADVDNDGDVDLNDWITLRQHLLGNINLHS